MENKKTIIFDLESNQKLTSNEWLVFDNVHQDCADYLAKELPNGEIDAELFLQTEEGRALVERNLRFELGRKNISVILKEI